MTDEPYTKLKRGEAVLKDGFCGLGAGSRGRAFAPGHLYLTDRRLIVESRLKTDRSTVTIALAAITHLEPLPDGFTLTVQQGEQAHRETVILWGEPEPWLQAIEAARHDAPAMRTALREGKQRTPVEKRRRGVLFGVVGVLSGALLVLALCIVVVSLWVTLP